MSVQKLFSVALGLTLLISFAVVAAIFYRAALGQAERETVRELRVILAAATATRGYSAEHVTPLLRDNPGPFHPEVVPAFAVKAVMRRFNEDFPGYVYTERALNPTNRDDHARSWQIDVIEAFRGEAAPHEMVGHHVEKGETLLYLAEPIRVSDQACLSCHGDPKDAPLGMVATYNSMDGFGWKMGEVVGAKFVTASLANRLDIVLGNVLWFLIALGSVLIIALTLAMLLLERAVAHQAQRLAAQAELLSVGDPGASELDERGPSEFRQLAQAINRLHRSLRLALDDQRERSDKVA